MSEIITLQGNEVSPARPALPVIGSEAPDAIELGRFIHHRHGVAHKIRYGGDQGIVVIGPNGKGKGTAVLMPNLLQLEGRSIVAIDPKGELAAVTAPYRRTLGRVVILNPFGVLTDIPGYDDLQSEGFNPLVRLDPSADNFMTQTAQLADAIITIDSKEVFFPQSARNLMAWLIMREAIAATSEGRAGQMSNVLAMLQGPHAEPAKDNDMLGIGLPALALHDVENGSPALAYRAGQFTQFTRTTEAIVSTAYTQTACFLDTEIARDMAKGDFDFSTIKREPVTVYLILPPLMLSRHAKWLRLVITAAIQAVMRPREKGEPRTLFMLDEFYALGHFEIISSVWSLVRGYGVQMMPVLQNIPQLKELYPDNWETFLGMAGAVTSFATNDQTTAEWLSKRGGDTTRSVSSTNIAQSESWGDGMGFSGGVGGNTSLNNHKGGGLSVSSNTSETRSTLISPHKLYGLRSGHMVGAFDGLSNLVPMHAPAYFRVRKYLDRARANPYFAGSR